MATYIGGNYGYNYGDDSSNSEETFKNRYRAMGWASSQILVRATEVWKAVINMALLDERHRYTIHPKIADSAVRKTLAPNFSAGVNTLTIVIELSTGDHISQICSDLTWLSFVTEYFKYCIGYGVNLAFFARVANSTNSNNPASNDNPQAQSQAQAENPQSRVWDQIMKNIFDIDATPPLLPPAQIQAAEVEAQEQQQLCGDPSCFACANVLAKKLSASRYAPMAQLFKRLDNPTQEQAQLLFDATDAQLHKLLELAARFDAQRESAEQKY